MSYQTLKRVLGESSLERKCRFAFGIAMLVLIGGSFYIYGSFTENQYKDEIRNQNLFTGRHLTSSLLAKAHWKGLETEPTSHEEIEDIWQDLNREEIKGIGTKLVDLDTAQRDYQEVIDQLLEEGEHLQPTPSSGRYDYQYLQVVRATEVCLGCHAYKALDVKPVVQEAGALMAVADIRFPEQSMLSFSRAILISSAIFTFSLAMLLAYFIVRYVIVKPLKHLKDVSDEISKGNLNLRSDINTGDEFEELSHAFNRMLRSLVHMQQQLRRVNEDLDAKVDQLAQANMALFEMNRLKGDFLATVSHELRTPLSSILGFSEVLDTSEKLSNKQHHWIHNIQNSGKMLLALINDILDLAKIESGKMDLRIEEFSLSDLLEGVVSMVRPLAEKKNIDLDYRMDAALPLLRQDAPKMKQIVDNLVSNAVKFTPEGGRVQIEAEHDKDQLLLRVSDTGIGIVESDQELIFEKFRQGSAVRSEDDWAAREVSGTGLGLSIVKELCRLLEGEVSVRSELGKGSVFTVRLPVYLNEKPAMEPDPGLSNKEPERVGKSSSAFLETTAVQYD